MLKRRQLSPGVTAERSTHELQQGIPLLQLKPVAAKKKKKGRRVLSSFLSEAETGPKHRRKAVEHRKGRAKEARISAMGRMLK